MIFTANEFADIHITVITGNFELVNSCFNGESNP